MSWGESSTRSSEPRLKMCNYRGRQCGTEIIWDNNMGFFKNTSNGQRHYCPSSDSSSNNSYTKPVPSPNNITGYTEPEATNQDINSAILQALNEINESHTKFEASMSKLEAAVASLTKSISDTRMLNGAYDPNDEVQESDVTEEEEWQEASSAKLKEDTNGAEV